MSAGATSAPSQPVAGQSAVPTTVPELVAQISDQLKQQPSGKWSIAGFNVANIWAIVLLGFTYAAPKFEDARQQVISVAAAQLESRDALKEIRDALKEIAINSRLTYELNHKQDQRLDALSRDVQALHSESKP